MVQKSENNIHVEAQVRPAVCSFRFDKISDGLKPANTGAAFSQVCLIDVDTKAHLGALKCTVVSRFLILGEVNCYRFRPR